MLAARDPGADRIDWAGRYSWSDLFVFLNCSCGSLIYLTGLMKVAKYLDEAAV